MMQLISGTSLILNWVVGPFVMLAMAWATLPDLPSYRTGMCMLLFPFRQPADAGNRRYIGRYSKMHRNGHDVGLSFSGKTLY